MLFLKHIYRSIKKSPLQPIIILITLTLAVATFITSVKICINVAKETAIYKNTDHYICDITVKPSKSDDIRLLFVEDCKEIIKDEGMVHGEFNLTALKNTDESSELIDVSAADLLSADRFYKFKFIEYGKITDRNINQSIILSSDAARNYNVKLGDTFSFNLLNAEMSFTVQGIAASVDFFRDTEALVNIGAVSAAIANANPAIASFAGSIDPYTVLKIRITDPSRIDEFIEKLSADERFKSKTVIKESSNVGSADFVHMISLLMMTVCSAMITLISAVVISTSLELLSKKRLKDSALFMLNGASNAQLNRLIYLECFIYSIIAAAVGLALSLGINKKINTIFDWNTDNITFKPYDIPIALFAAPAIVLITAVIHTAREKNLSISERIAENSENKAKSFSLKVPLLLGTLAVVFIIPTFFIDTTLRIIFAIPSLLSFLVFIYLFIPCLTDIISRFLIKLAEKSKRIPAKAILALKNLNVSYPLKHTARLITILITLMCSAFFSLHVLTKETNKLTTLVDCNYISIAANEKTDALLENLDEVEDTFRFKLIKTIVTEKKTAVLGISVAEDSKEYLNPKIAPKRLPQGDEVVITSGIANLENKKVGDSISFIYETNKYTFTVSEIIKSSSNVVFFSAEKVGESNDVLCIKTSAVKNSKEYQNIANLLETRGAAIVDIDTVLSPLTERLLSYSELLAYVIFIAFFTTVLGIINVLFSAYVSRKQERAVYYTVGMTRRQIIATQLSEFLYVALISLIAIPVLSLATILILDIGVSSFGIDLFYI